jgi:hypothetical protein
MHFGPNEILLNFNLKFRAGLSASQIGSTVEYFEKDIRKSHRTFRHISIDVEGLTGTKSSY